MVESIDKLASKFTKLVNDRESNRISIWIDFHTIFPEICKFTGTRVDNL